MFHIQNDIPTILLKMEMKEAMGITDQREGFQITSRETVGGVERSVLQSFTYYRVVIYYP